LAQVLKVDFFQANYGGNTPLTHAVAFGRVEIVQWLREEQTTPSEDDEIAASLANDFYVWTDGEDAKRRQVLQLFQDDYYWHKDGGIDQDDEGVSVNQAQEVELEEY
jgi:hypothetical protein